MSEELTGRCNCGIISYRCKDTPKFSIMCQCRQCQRITGTGHSAQFAVDADSVLINGTVKIFELISDRGSLVRSAFCATCGSPIYKTTSVAHNMIMFHAGTLDEPANYQPQMAVHSDSGQPWDYIDPQIPRKKND